MTITDQVTILLNSEALARFLVGAGVMGILWLGVFAFAAAYLFWMSR